MILRMKPKSFGPVFALFDGTDTIRFAFDDPSETTPHPPSQTPVDTLLASLAACIVKSVQMAANQHKATLNPFMVKVTANKAPDPPGRVEQMQITIIGQLVDDGSLAQKLVKQAKAMCTVSNSLNCTVTIATQAAADA